MMFTVCKIVGLIVILISKRPCLQYLYLFPVSLAQPSFNVFQGLCEMPCASAQPHNPGGQGWWLTVKSGAAPFEPREKLPNVWDLRSAQHTAGDRDQPAVSSDQIVGFSWKESLGDENSSGGPGTWYRARMQWQSDILNCLKEIVQTKF